MNRDKCTGKQEVDLAAKTQLYRGYDAEHELSFNGCVFHAAHHLRLVDSGDTGFGWNNAEICDLTDQVRAAIESDPTVLDDFPTDTRVKLFEGLNISSAERV
jgi:hypothetical protein